MLDLIERVEGWCRRKKRDLLTRRFGGTQICCWCRQCAQDRDGWSFKPWQRDRMLDVLTCSVCGGTSLWSFQVGMLWVGPLEPPSCSREPAAFYDITAAALKARRQSNG